MPAARALRVACLAAGCLVGCAPVQVVDAPLARIEAPAPRPGARWTYDEIDAYRREVVGSLSQDAGSGAARQSFSAPYTKLPFPLAPGMRWTERVDAVDELGGVHPWRISSWAHGWERIRTPAGEFDALRVEHRMALGNAEMNWREAMRTETLWYAPAVNGWVKIERRDSQRELAGLSQRSRDDWRIWELREYTGG